MQHSSLQIHRFYVTLMMQGIQYRIVNASQRQDRNISLNHRSKKACDRQTT